MKLLAKYHRIEDCEIGEDTVVRDFVNLYGCKIGEGCRIAAYVEIQRGVVVGVSDDEPDALELGRRQMRRAQEKLRPPPRTTHDRESDALHCPSPNAAFLPAARPPGAQPIRPRSR